MLAIVLTLGEAIFDRYVAAFWQAGALPAVLAAIARSNGAPEDASHIWSCPVRAFTVVARNWFGQGCPTNGANIDLATDASSLIVCALSAILPISARISSGLGDCAARTIAAAKSAMRSD